MLEQSEMYGTTLRIAGVTEEPQQVEPTYEQTRAALIDLVTAALRDTHGEAQAQVEIVDLGDERVVLCLGGSIAEIHGRLTGAAPPARAS